MLSRCGQELIALLHGLGATPTSLGIPKPAADREQTTPQMVCVTTLQSAG
jgi:hypothetical protein